MSATYTQEQVQDAKAAIKREVMILLGGTCGTAFVGVTVDDEDAIRHLNWATIEELMA